MVLHLLLVYVHVCMYYFSVPGLGASVSGTPNLACILVHHFVGNVCMISFEHAPHLCASWQQFVNMTGLAIADGLSSAADTLCSQVCLCVRAQVCSRVSVHATEHARV